MQVTGIEIINGYDHLQGGIKSGGSSEGGDPPYSDYLSPDEIVALRKRLGLSQAEAAYKWGMKQQTISLIEIGETSHRAKSWRRYIGCLTAEIAKTEQAKGKAIRARADVRPKWAASAEEKTPANDFSEPIPPGGGDEGGPPAPFRKRRHGHGAVHPSQSIRRSAAIDPETGHVVVTETDPEGHSFSFAVTSLADTEQLLKFLAGVQAMAPAEK